MERRKRVKETKPDLTPRREEKSMSQAKVPKGKGAANDENKSTYSRRDRNKKNDKVDQRNEYNSDKPPKTTKRLTGETRSMIEMRRGRDDTSRRSTLTAPVVAKACFFYKDDDYNFHPVKIPVHPKKYRKFDTLLQELSRRVPGLAFGCRSIYTPGGNTQISNLDGLTHDGAYVCCTDRRHAKGLDVSRINPMDTWRHTRPVSDRILLNTILNEDIGYPEDTPRKRHGPYDMAAVYNRSQPKKITVMLNGEPDIHHLLLLNRKTAQTFEQVMEDLSSMFGIAVRKLYTIDGRRIQSLSQVFGGPESYVVTDDKPFKFMDGKIQQARLPKRKGATEQMAVSRIRDKKDRLNRTKGQWKLYITTNELPSAGTPAQVTMYVYGDKGNSGPITIGRGDGHHFQNGHIDEFEISVGNVGEIYKIRIGHDNSGDFPGWLCDEVRMKDKDTLEELVFPCGRWLARDDDDHEICRELPAVRRAEPILPITKYEVHVTTGDLWNAQTDANVYMTLYGDRGDTGVRQLYTENKENHFRQGQSDVFYLEAVSLGHLRRAIVGHDGTGPGSGWHLEKIAVREPGARLHEENVFHCGKWLDEGEEDGKIVRELKIQDEYMDDILEKRNWDYERWKFNKDSQVMFYSVTTGKALRLKSDGSVDGLGDDHDSESVFVVDPKKAMNRMFCSVGNPNQYLAIDNGKVSGLGKGGPYCEFRIRVQNDRSVLLEAVKSPLQFITIEDDGKPGDVRGILDKNPSRRYHVYCKGTFRHRGVVMLCTSATQTVNIDSDGTLRGTGKRIMGSQFRVHKVSAGRVRMFESIADPGKYIRLKDGKVDCKGGRDINSQFIVEKHRDGGYTALQSAEQRGIYIGMAPDGQLRPTVDTGVNNIWFYPEVVEFGVPKSQSTALVEEEAMESGRKSPVEEPRRDKVEKKSYQDGDWSIHVTTIEKLKDADVALIVYGHQGNSGPITLSGPSGKTIFQEGNTDEFRANLAKVGKINKIRLELVPKNTTKDPHWKVKEVKMTDLNTEDNLDFVFNSYLSRRQGDMEISRELPAVHPGEEPLPVFKYYVMVQTGKEEGSNSDAKVYLNIYGERGDTGKRALIKSNNAMKFRIGQLDVFEVEAVSLGPLTKCIVGHDGTGSGEGWYLDHISIRESEKSKEEFNFPCSKWLDTAMEDSRIERTLPVAGR